jgi:hypothetical protein
VLEGVGHSVTLGGESLSPDRPGQRRNRNGCLKITRFEVRILIPLGRHAYVDERVTETAGPRQTPKNSDRRVLDSVR